MAIAHLGVSHMSLILKGLMFEVFFCSSSGLVIVVSDVVTLLYNGILQSTLIKKPLPINAVVLHNGSRIQFQNQNLGKVRRYKGQHEFECYSS